MSLLNNNWSWQDSTISSAATTSSSSPKSSGDISTFQVNGGGDGSDHSPATSIAIAIASGSHSGNSIMPSTNTGNSNVSSSNSSTSNSSSSTTTRKYTSKSDAFFSSYSSMEPLKPPSPIFSRRASESCLPPPCAAKNSIVAKVIVGASSPSSCVAGLSTQDHGEGTTRGRTSAGAGERGTARERFSSLPDIVEYKERRCIAGQQGLGINAPFPRTNLSSSSSTTTTTTASSSSNPAPAFPPTSIFASSTASTSLLPQASASSSSASASASTSMSASTSSSALSSGSSSPSRQSQPQPPRISRQSSFQDIEARLQAAIAELGSASGSNITRKSLDNENDGDDDDDSDMYNDEPTSSGSSSRTASRLSNSSSTSTLTRRQQQQRERQNYHFQFQAQQQQEETHSVFEEDDNSDEDDENGGTTIHIRLASGPISRSTSTTTTSSNTSNTSNHSNLMSTRRRTFAAVDSDDDEDIYDEDDDDTPFVPCYPLAPLEVVYKPLHRIRRNRSLRRALSDSCTSNALQSDSSRASQNTVRNWGGKKKSAMKCERPQGSAKRNVSFSNEVKVVDVFAAIDYPARRGPLPIERLTMRDVLELRQIKLELAAYMGEAYPPTPVLEEEEDPFQAAAMMSEEDVTSDGMTAHIEHVGRVDEEEEEQPSMPSTPLMEASPELESVALMPSLSMERSESNTSSTMGDATAPVSASKSSTNPNSLGPGMEIDLHSLIVPSSSSLALEQGDTTQASSSIESSISTSMSTSQIVTTSATTPSSSSSEPSLSASNSLSCSPSTSDSESFDNLSLSTEEEEEEEFGDELGDDSSSSSVSRRGSDDTSCETCEEDDEEVDEGYDHALGDSGVEVYEREIELMKEGSTRTPSRISLLGTQQHSHAPFDHVKSTTKPSKTKKNGMKDQFDAGCITIALPVLDSDEGYTATHQASFDLSSTTRNHRDPWHPSTF